MNNSLSSSWQFRRTTVTTLSTIFATASVLVRWCMAWFTFATYRYGPCQCLCMSRISFKLIICRVICTFTKLFSGTKRRKLQIRFCSEHHFLQVIFLKMICLWTSNHLFNYNTFNLHCCPGEADSHRYGNSNDSCSVSWPGPPWLQQHVRLPILPVGVLTDRAVQMPIDPSMFWHPLHNTVVDELWN